VRFENKNVLFYICKNAQAYYKAGAVVVNSEVVCFEVLQVLYNLSSCLLIALSASKPLVLYLSQSCQHRNIQQQILG
jgi:hypothetical protein